MKRSFDSVSRSRCFASISSAASAIAMGVASPAFAQYATATSGYSDQAHDATPYRETLPGLNGSLTSLLPRFTVEAVGFRAVDESGADWAGSDEVITVFRTARSYTLGENPPIAVTHEFGNVDTGDEREYAATERCIAPRRVIRNADSDGVLQAPQDAWECDEGGFSHSIEFSVSMYEADSWQRWIDVSPDFCAPATPSTEELDQCTDDLIGRATITYAEGELARILPWVGATTVRTITLGGPCGHQESGSGCASAGLHSTGPEYEFTYVVTRVADREIGPIVTMAR